MSVLSSDLISLYTLQEYIDAVGSFGPTDKLSNAVSDSLADGQFYYDSTAETVHVFKTNTINRAYFAIKLADFSVGDVVEAEMDVLSISGVGPNITADILPGTKSGSEVAAFAFTQNQLGQNNWNHLRLKFVYPYYDRNGLAINFGIGTTDTGEFKIKNVRVKTQKQHKLRALNNEIKTFNIEKISGSWTILGTFGNSEGTLSLENSNTALRLTYDRPFNAYRRPVAIAAVDHAGTGSSYRVLTSGSNMTNVLLYLQSAAGGSDLSWTSVPDGLYFAVTVTGGIY